MMTDEAASLSLTIGAIRVTPVVVRAARSRAAGADRSRHETRCHWLVARGCTGGSDGHAASSSPGAGLTWNAEAVSRYQAT
jgi:hypothetical protein